MLEMVSEQIQSSFGATLVKNVTAVLGCLTNKQTKGNSLPFQDNFITISV